MNSKRLLQTGIVFLSVIYVQLAGAQIVSKPDPKLSFDRSRGIIVLLPSMKGSFYLNDHFLTEIKGRDTIYIINVKPGEYSAKVVFISGSTTNDFILDPTKVLEIIPEPDTLKIKRNAFYYNDIAEKAAGKTVFYLSRGSYFNITQVAFYSYQFGPSPEILDTKWFRTFTTINGFQIVPGFCTGLGLSYTNYDIPVVYRGMAYYMTHLGTKAEIQNVSFLPVFLDVRAYMSSRQVAPFLKLDVGYNILLSKKSMSVNSYNYRDVNDYIFQIAGGGIYLSPGFGLRIAATKLIQVIASVEYSYELYTRKLSSETQQFGLTHYGLNFFKFNIGIGFQKKVW